MNRGQYEAVGAEKLANLQQQAQRFGGLWKLLFFSCGICTVTAGALSLLCAITALTPPFDFINYVFMTIFGLIMMTIDSPIDNAHIRGFKANVFIYAMFMTRFTGRGIWNLFLATMIVGALWDNNVSPFLGFFLGGYVTLVAVYSIAYGMRLSSKLEKVRLAIVAQGPEQWGNYIPPSGMTKLQLRDLSNSLGGIDFSDEEQGYIIAALSNEIRPDEVISKEEFDQWCGSSSMVVL